MDRALHERLITLLLDSDLDDIAIHLVEAACEGERAFATALEDLGGRARPARPSAQAQRAGGGPPGAYLERLDLTGFRGVGARVAVDFTPGPGLTLIVGRNGSGKSSIAEGLETALTGESGRWKDRRSKLWKDGWRNLHSRDAEARLEARFVVEGSSALTVTRSWAPGEEPEAGTLRVRDRGGTSHTLDELGWTSALTAFRPFLSYPELGALVEQPSKAFDELWGLLGLHELTSARELLSQHTKAVAAVAKQAKQERDALLEALTAIDDPRAAVCVERLSGRRVDLDALEAVLAGDESSVGERGLEGLRALARIAVPPEERIREVTGAHRAALERRAALAGETAEQHARLARVLEHALSHLATQPAVCPVCERPVDADFVAQARARLARSSELARDVRAADDAVAASHRAVTGLFQRLVEAPLAPAHGLGLDRELAAAAEALQAYRVEPLLPGELAAHAESAGRDLAAAMDALSQAARQALATLEEAFEPMRRRLVRWIADARSASARAELEKHVKAAEKWLSDAEVELRDERFAPIAAQVRSTWEALGHTSHVALGGVTLAGRATKRHIDFDVRVDGHEAAAVAVMSQGELNALALSLFLPRMMLPESPFRFLIIDDPVQAMDPVKVDGLAHVLAEAAKTRQVIVLTHDERLLDAVRRMRIEATVLEVSRRASSVIEIERTLGPVQGHISDARALLGRGGDAVGVEIVARLVPGFCRGALEAACVETVRRRRLGRGDPHEQVEHAIGDAHGLMQLTALAYFDDAGRAQDVFKRVNKLGQWAGDTLRGCKEGAHGSFMGDPRSLVDYAEKLARDIEALS